MPSLPQVHALGANKTGLPGLLLSYASIRGLWLPHNGWADLSPYANNGSATDVTYSGTAPFARMPIVPGSFNGSSSRVSITDATSLQFTSAMTAVIWYAGDPAVNSTIFGSYGYGTGHRRWRINRDSISVNRVVVTLSADGTSTNIKYYYLNTATFGTAWNQYAFTFASSTLTVYLNGATASVTKYTDNAITNIYSGGSPPTQIGCSDNSGTPGLFASGSYACAAVFNAALTAADIQAMYLVGANGP